MTILHEPGDQLRADKIKVFARKIRQPWRSDSHRTGRHETMETAAEDSAICIIEKKARWIPDRS